MKKFLITSLILFTASSPNLFSYADEWDNLNNIDNIWDGQKTITNKEFDEVVNALEEKQKTKKKKKKRRFFKKVSGGGTSLHNELNPDNEINTVEILKPKTDGVLVNAHVNLYLNGNLLEKGYYKVIANKDDDNKIYLNFYQSQYFKGKIEAYETQNDFDEKEIDFVKLLPCNESFMKIIFGSLDYNLYAYIPYTE